MTTKNTIKSLCGMLSIKQKMEGDNIYMLVSFNRVIIRFCELGIYM